MNTMARVFFFKTNANVTNESSSAGLYVAGHRRISRKQTQRPKLPASMVYWFMCRQPITPAVSRPIVHTVCMHVHEVISRCRWCAFICFDQNNTHLGSVENAGRDYSRWKCGTGLLDLVTGNYNLQHCGTTLLPTPKMRDSCVRKVPNYSSSSSSG